MRATNKTLPAPAARTLDELTALPPDAFLNPEEVRIYARLESRQAVYNWLNDKDDPLRASKKGRWRILKSDLDAYLRKKRSRRASDQAIGGTSDETLQKNLGLLIEIVQAVIAWKRASAIFRAAQDSTFTSAPDEEWINTTFADMNLKREQLYRLTSSISEETLTSLRFMLPSIHSDLALAGDSTNQVGESGSRAVDVAGAKG